MSTRSIWEVNRSRLFCSTCRCDPIGPSVTVRMWGGRAQEVWRHSERESVCLQSVCVCVRTSAQWYHKTLFKTALKLYSVLFLDMLHLCLDTNMNGSEGIDTDEDAEEGARRERERNRAFIREQQHSVCSGEAGVVSGPFWVILSWVWWLMIKRRKFPTLDGYHSDSYITDPMIVR